MKVLYSIIAIVFCFNLFSQRGKDGATTITVANTIVNQYTSLIANVSSGSKTLTVSNSTAFNVGDLVFIIQMQGASVNAYHGGFTGPWFDSQSALPTDSSYGRITNYNNCGRNEFAQISSIPNATSIVLDCDLKHSYDANVVSTINTGSGTYTINLPGNVQVIKVPRYTSLTINTPGSITCPAWNGSTGGIAVVEVENNTTLNSSPSFSVSGKGFRGGAKDNANSVFGGDKYGSNNTAQGGIKGESIGGDTAIFKLYASLAGRGAIANGGGGGCAHNAGGGGGANGGNILGYTGYGNPNISVSTYTAIWNRESPAFSSTVSSGGGRGGYAFSNTNVTLNSASNPPGSTNWGGDSRRNTGGFGGRPLNYSTGRLFIGGGGGAGDGNENKAGAGGNGGGMVYLVCYGNLSGAGTIVADGANGLSSTPGCSTNDAGGGGGGGGTIILNINGTTNLTASPALSAKGGNGGSVVFSCVAFNDDGYGPGASGGGGYISVSGTLPANSVVAGSNGIVTGNNSNIAAQFPMNGATNGGAGGTGTITNYTLTPSASQTLCTNQAFTVTATSTQPSATIYWYNSIVGGTSIATGTAYASPGYTTAGTYTLFAGDCGGTYRQPVILTVGAGLNITVNSPTICPGQTITLTANGATSYTWSTGATTNTINVAPSSTASYTVNGMSGLCSGNKTTTVTVNSTPTISVSSATICAGNSTTLTANGATSYTWAPGGQTTTSIVVSPTVNTTYTITGANGTCTNSTTASVSITPSPTLTVNSPSICAGQVATLTASGATNYTWTPGSTTGTSYTIAPASTTTINVIGAIGSCTTQVSRTITVNSSPTITVNSPTICPGQTVTLTANGAASYTWNTGPATNTISVSPASTTNYTVTGSNGTCSSSKTTTVTVAAVPSVSVTSASICSGGSATLTASGATTYTWIPGGQTTTSISVTPSVSTIYTITGTNGTCTNTSSATVSVTSTPTLVVNSATICPTQTATLTVSGASSYTWNPGSVSGSSYTIAPASNTTISVIGANGTCTTQATGSVTIGANISITVNSPTICAGQTASLTASGATTYTWNTGANTSTLAPSPGSTTVYTISGTQGGCNGSNTSTVTVVGQPTISVIGNNSICSGSSTTLTANGANTFTWMPGGQTTTSVSLNPASTSNYTITGSNGICSASTVTSINVTNTPTLTVNPTTICAGQTATLNASGAASYTWSPGGSTGSSYTAAPVSNTTVSVIGANGICTAQTTSSITVSGAIAITVNSPTICAGQTASLSANGAATYTWNTGANTSTLNISPGSTTIYTISGSNGSCTGSNTATVTVNSLPTLTVSSNNICTGQTATLTVTGANTYTWSNSNNNTSQTVSPIATTVYTVSGTDNNGCVSSGIYSTTVTVTPTPTISVNSASICAGQTATLTASGATNYTWSTTANTSSISVSPAITSNYTVNGTNGGCYTSTTAIISVSPSPSITVNALNTTGCPTLCVNFSETISPATSTFTYNFGDGLSSNTSNPTHCYANGGNYTVVLTAADAGLGCSSTFTLPTIINVINNPVADFSVQGGNIVFVNNTVQLTNNSSNAISYVWDLCNGNTSILPDVTTSYADTGSCCITLLAVNGTCTNSVTKCIDIINDITINIPNVFTPNGDQKNDLFKITGNGIKNLQCSIYDRWGLKLFEWTGINGGWDGNVKTGIAPSGTYYYIINYTDLKEKSTTEKGFLNLFRD